MKNLLLALAVLLFCPIATASSQYDSQPLTAWEALAKYRAWTLLCTELQSELSCKGLKAPVVIFEHMEGSVRGYTYLEADIIHISASLTGTQRIATLVHEMMHYLESHVRGVKKPLTSYFRVCESEKYAWDVTDKYWRAIGHPERAVDGAWVRWYMYCTPYASVLYPKS